MSPTLDLLAGVVGRIAAASDGEYVPIPLESFGAALHDAVWDLPATQHPLGFFHFELTEALSQSQARIRLHIWTSTSMAARAEEDGYHAHTWILRSCVLVGSLHDTSYTAARKEDGEFIEYELQYPDDVVRRTGFRCTLTAVRELDVAAGHVYTLQDGVPHRTALTSLPTATLVIARESGRTRTCLYRRMLDRPEGRALRRPLSVEEAQTAIAAVFGAVGS